MKVFVTRNASLTCFHVARRLIERGDAVVSLNGVSNCCDLKLKEAGLAISERIAKEAGVEYTFAWRNIAGRSSTAACFAAHKSDHVVHVAVQVGVRHGLAHPHTARRRARHVRGPLGAREDRQLQARRTGEGRREAFRRVVSGLLWRLGPPGRCPLA
jgi:hypothetical protein